MAILMTQTDVTKYVQCYLDGNAQVTKTNLVNEKTNVEMEKWFIELMVIAMMVKMSLRMVAPTPALQNLAGNAQEAPQNPQTPARTSAETEK